MHEWNADLMGRILAITYTNLVRRTDPFFAHYLFPISCNVACSSEVQVCRKAKSPWGRRLDLPRATIYPSFKGTSFMAKRIVTCHARFESSSEI
jgi:hypothetical protein